MNISLNWLTDYVDVTLPAAELGELFTRIGLNCEGITHTDSDIVFDLEVTSNRPDCLGHIGVARELAAATGKTLRRPEVLGKEVSAAGQPAADFTAVDVQAPDLCPRYTARVIRNVKVAPSPQWLVDHLQAVGLRSVNNVVDITNFVLMEYSQPLHAFDYDKLDENRIVVRRASKGEKLLSIDETTCELTEDMLVIADANKPIAIAGVMGGLDTEVGQATTTVLIESAQFDPLNTRHTSRALGLMSDSNFRFERGVDPLAIDEASLRACQLICELAGGELADGLVDVWAEPFESPVVTLRPERTDKLLGITTPPERQVEILAALGLGPKLQDGKIVCTIPPFRADLTREVDLIEEVARLVEYDNIPTGGKVSHPIMPMGQTERIRREVISTLRAAGFSEAITFSFIDAEEAVLFGVDNPLRVDANVRKTNNALRPSLLPSLLKACKNNQALGNDDLGFFELAAVFPPGESTDSSLPAEFVELAMVSTDDLRDTRGAMEAAVGRIAPEAKITVLPKACRGFAEDVSAEILLDGQPVGAMGRISPDIQRYYGLEKSIAAAVLRFDALEALANLTRTTQPLAKFPPIRRDLSLILDEAVTWEKLSNAIQAIDQPLRASEEYVTTYRGKPIPKGKKSVTIAMEYRWAEGTLQNARVDEEVQSLMEGLQKEFEVTLRG